MELSNLFQKGVHFLMSPLNFCRTSFGSLIVGAAGSLATAVGAVSVAVEVSIGIASVRVLEAGVSLAAVVSSADLATG